MYCYWGRSYWTINSYGFEDTGANVIISEVQETRIRLAKSLGFDVINPMQDNMEEEINQRTNRKVPM